MEVRYDDTPRNIRADQPTYNEPSSTPYPAPQYSSQEETHTTHGNEPYQSLFSDKPSPDREHMLLSALAHAAEEHEAAEQAMRLSEQRYRRLFETSKDSIIIIETAHATVVNANPAAERLLAMSRPEACHRPIAELSPFANVPGIEKSIDDLATGRTTHEEIRIPATDGDIEQHLDIVASVYRENAQSIAQLSIRDITDRKKTVSLEAKTADLLAERRELIAVNSAKDEFISVASHQLRTPATAVKQYLGLLLQGYVGRLTRNQRHTLERAYDGNERQLKIINDLLLVARVDAGKVTLVKQTVDLPRLIRDVTMEQQSVLERRRQPLTLNLPRTLKADIDERFLRMVLENLLSNASKYSPDGSPIIVTVWRTRKHLSVAITDKGFGISEADQSKLYRKFSRIYNEHATTVEGTGLGLYWSKKIIELHDGTLTLTSGLDQGSTFTIHLPIR